MIRRGNAEIVYCDRAGHALGIQSKDGTILWLFTHFVDRVHVFICPECLRDLQQQHLPLHLAKTVWHPTHRPKPQLPPREPIAKDE